MAMQSAPITLLVTDTSILAAMLSPPITVLVADTSMLEVMLATEIALSVAGMSMMAAMLFALITCLVVRAASKPTRQTTMWRLFLPSILLKVWLLS